MTAVTMVTTTVAVTAAATVTTTAVVQGYANSRHSSNLNRAQ